MARRWLVAATFSTVPMAVALLAAIPAEGQGPSAAAKSARAVEKPYVPPRTPDGQPDLQGFWTNSSYTPLERPDGVTKEFYTPDEAIGVVQQAAKRESEQTVPGTVADVHYDFTQFGLDRSQSPFARNLRTSLIVDPPNGKLPPLSEEGKKRAAERAAARKAMGGPNDAIQNMPVGARCLIMAGAGPPMLDSAYNNNYHFVQGPGYVLILVEMIHDARLISLDGRPQPPAGVRQWMGVSRGRWEGNTLVVETTNGNGKNPIRGSTENLRVTESFTRVADDRILYKFTLEDAATWTRPWTAELPMQKTKGPIFEHACHEGNYGAANTLAGARAAEKKAAEEAAKKGVQ